MNSDYLDGIADKMKAASISEKLHKLDRLQEKVRAYGSLSDGDIDELFSIAKSEVAKVVGIRQQYHINNIIINV